MTSGHSRKPKDRIDEALAIRGEEPFVAGCIAILQGTDDEPVLADVSLIDVLGGPHAWLVLDTGPSPDQAYWLRVWAMRGLLWCYLPEARHQVAVGLSDSHWRVREMAAKVAARHGVTAAQESLNSVRRDDDNARVRAAADRAWRVIEGS